jgi:competence ComEA-like helix-hairpin-helix protein
MLFSQTPFYQRFGALFTFSKSRTFEIQGYLSWDEFSTVQIEKVGNRNIRLGIGNYFNMSASAFDVDLLIQLLQGIQRQLFLSDMGVNFMNPPWTMQTGGTQTHTSSQTQTFQMQTFQTAFEMPPIVTRIEFPRIEIPMFEFPTFEMPTNGWMVAVAGQQFGPYDIQILESLVNSGQISPETAYVWRPGMTSWVPFMQQPELAALVNRNNRNTVPPQTPPPPPPPPTAPPEPPRSEVDREETVSKDTVSKETASKETVSKETKTESEDIRYVDVNTASYEELVEILGVGAVDAKRIIQEREAIGGFQTAEQIGELLGLKPHQVEKIRKLARFTPIPKKQNNSRVVDY